MYVESQELWGKVTRPALTCRRCLRDLTDGKRSRFVVDSLDTLTWNPDEAA